MVKRKFAACHCLFWSVAVLSIFGPSSVVLNSMPSGTILIVMRAASFEPPSSCGIWTSEISASVKLRRVRSLKLKSAPMIEPLLRVTVRLKKSEIQS